MRLRINGFDPWLRTRDMIILIIEHDVSCYGVCERIIVLDHGVIAKGLLKNKQDKRLLRPTLGRRRYSAFHTKH